MTSLQFCMQRHLTSGMQHTHRTAAHCHTHSLADQPPGNRVSIAIHFDGAIGPNTSQQIAGTKGRPVRIATVSDVGVPQSPPMLLRPLAEYEAAIGGDF